MDTAKRVLSRVEDSYKSVREEKQQLEQELKHVRETVTNMTSELEDHKKMVGLKDQEIHRLRTELRDRVDAILNESEQQDSRALGDALRQL